MKSICKLKLWPKSPWSHQQEAHPSHASLKPSMGVEALLKLESWSSSRTSRRRAWPACSKSSSILRDWILRSLTLPILWWPKRRTLRSHKGTRRWAHLTTWFKWSQLWKQLPQPSTKSTAPTFQIGSSDSRHPQGRRLPSAPLSIQARALQI